MSGFSRGFIDPYSISYGPQMGLMGQSCRLVGDDGGRLEVLLEDNLTGFAEHYFYALGYKEV